MAHVALVDENNIVQAVHVINNEDLPNEGSFSAETEKAANEIQHSLGFMGDWKLTSYNDQFRGRFAGIGYSYDPDVDEFSIFDSDAIPDSID